MIGLPSPTALVMSSKTLISPSSTLSITNLTGALTVFSRTPQNLPMPVTAAWNQPGRVEVRKWEIFAPKSDHR